VDDANYSRSVNETIYPSVTRPHRLDGGSRGFSVSDIQREPLRGATRRGNFRRDRLRLLALEIPHDHMVAGVRLPQSASPTDPSAATRDDTNRLTHFILSAPFFWRF
jgi:hypothetical protein